MLELLIVASCLAIFGAWVVIIRTYGWRQGWVAPAFLILLGMAIGYYLYLAMQSQHETANGYTCGLNLKKLSLALLDACRLF